ncbi:hypothetical protein CEP54_007432 [Fusarium duplospermum]|uniref:Negative regulator of differentiation 1 n=1 Tax=Fusarium duplospermum TaxID=1325734 RepID=A0A428Q1I8_9HYPO|nr:hypothetical protein CEP54_007432 [Fusarium duplospermum]
MSSTQNQNNPQSQGVYVSQAEYDRLVKIAQRYACLRQKLIDQGISNDALDLLSDPDSFPSHGDSYQPNSGDYVHNPRAPPYQGHRQTETNREWPHPDTDPFPVSQSSSVESPTEPWSQEPKSPQVGNRCDPNRRLERNAQRSIRLFNLPSGVRRGDITAVIRGGPLLEVYLRPKEHTATVSFVYGDDAAAFLERAREQGLRIRNTTIPVKWNDQQFVLAPHVCHQISRGATRNFVIRNRNPNITEESIREDLAHIHNLHVLKVEFFRDECYISTNSVHNAIFARTCMMSRLEYKGSRIEWADDECAQAPRNLPTLAQSPGSGVVTKRTVSSSSMSKSQITNRFRVLDVTDDYDEDEDDSLDDSDDSEYS